MPMWFGKVYNTQYSLLAMLKKWKTAVNKRKAFGELFTDLSKAFDCLSHDLLFAKLHADGFIISALTLIHSYLTNRKQRAKVKLLNSPWTEVLFGVPQRYILGTFIAQHLSVWPIFHNEQNWLCKLGMIHIWGQWKLSKFQDPLCITASGNILARGNISLKLFMAPLETIEPLTFWYVVDEHHIAQL